MQLGNTTVTRLGLLAAIIAVASGCPSSPTAESSLSKPSSTVKKSPTPKPGATTAAAANSGGSNDSSATPTPGATGATNSPTTTPVLVPSAKTSTDATSSGTASTDPAATSTASTDPASTATATPKPSTSPTTAPTASPTATPTPVAVKGGGNVTTFAGQGRASSINALNATDAAFNSPTSLALQAGKAIFVADGVDHTVRRIDLAGTHAVTSVAGSSAGYHDGIGQSAAFNQIHGIAVDASGGLLVSDSANSCIRRIDFTDPVNPSVSTYAGAQGISGAVNGTGAVARFFGLNGIAVSGTKLYIAEGSNHDIRMLDLADAGHAVTTIAGTGTVGSSDGPGTVAQFTTPNGLAVDATGAFLYVTDSGANRVRRISLTDGNFTVSLVAGVGAAGSADGTGGASAFNNPSGCVVGGDKALYVSDKGNQTVRRIDLNDTNFNTTTYAGGVGMAGFTDSQGSNARFSGPAGLTAIGSAIYVADPGNFRVRLAQ